MIHGEYDYGCEECLDIPMSEEEILFIRSHYQRPDFSPAPSVDPLHQGWTDTEVMLLSPLWNFDHPCDEKQLLHIIENHPVQVARPRQPYFEDVFYCYARYCLRRFRKDGTEEWLDACGTLANAHHFDDVQYVYRQEIENMIMRASRDPMQNLLEA